jgi:hypothetical protein
VHYPVVESFDADYDRHLVGSDSPHHFTRAKYGEKYGYPMLDPVALDRPMLVNSTGNVARGAEETDFAPYDGPWPLHTAGGVFNPHLDWDEPDVSAAVHAYLHPDEVMGYARHDNEWRNLGNMDKLMGHLSEHGMLEPIYIGAGPEHAVIEDGHHRALAAQALGWGKVPVHITNDPHLGDEYETPHGPGLRVYLNGDRR